MFCFFKLSLLARSVLHVILDFQHLSLVDPRTTLVSFFLLNDLFSILRLTFSRTSMFEHCIVRGDIYLISLRLCDPNNLSY